MGPETAFIASALISAGASQVVASKQRGAQRRIATMRQKQQKALEDQRRRIATRNDKRAKEQEAQKTALADARGQQLQNRLLDLKNIENRPAPKGFSGVTSAVLDEGATG